MASTITGLNAQSGSNTDMNAGEMFEKGTDTNFDSYL